MVSRWLFTLLIILLLGNLTYAYEPTDSSSNKCSDSDNGIKYKVKGTITLGNSNYLDKCINQEVLQEFYCAGSRVLSQNYKCAYACSNGACTETFPKKTSDNKPIQKSQKTQESVPSNSIEITCYDSDSGIDIFRNGIATLTENGKETTSSDFCASNNILNENYCKFSTQTNEWKIEQFNYNCECTNGRCLQKLKPSNIQQINNIQASPKQSFMGKLLSFIGFKSTPTTQAIRNTQKQEFSLSWLILLLFMIGGLLYLRSIYNETPKKKTNQKAFKSKK